MNKTTNKQENNRLNFTKPITKIISQFATENCVSGKRQTQKWERWETLRLEKHVFSKFEKCQEKLGHVNPILQSA